MGQVGGVIPAQIVQQANHLSSLAHPVILSFFYDKLDVNIKMFQLGLVAQELASKIRQEDLTKLKMLHENLLQQSSKLGPPTREKSDSKVCLHEKYLQIYFEWNF